MTLNPNQPDRPNHEKDPSAPDDHQLPPFPESEHDTRIPEAHQRDDSGIVQDRIAALPSQSEKKSGVPLWAKVTAPLAAFAIGGGAYLMGKGGSKGSPVDDPSRPVVTAPVSPSLKTPNHDSGETKPRSVDATSLLAKTTYHSYIKKNPDQKEALDSSIAEKVDISPSEWVILPLKERASRTALYVQRGTEKCMEAGILGSNPLTSQSNLDAVNWSPYVNENLIQSASKGDVNSLKQVETIRQMYECSVGSALDANGVYSQQIKDNLTNPTTGLYLRPENDVVNRPDYMQTSLQSALNVETFHKYGGTVETFPITVDEKDTEGALISAPSPAWYRPSGPKHRNFSIIPIQTNENKTILGFGYSEES